VSRKTHNNRTWFAAVVLLAVFALIATACTGDTATTIVGELRGEGQCPSTGVTAARASWFAAEVLKEYSASV